MSLIKKMLPRSLLGRSLLILIIPVVLIQVITTFMFFDRHWNKMSRRLAFAVSGEVASITAMAEENSDDENIRRIKNSFGRYLDFDVSFEPGGVLPSELAVHDAPPWEGHSTGQLRAELDAQIANDFVLQANFHEENVTIFVALSEGILKFVLPQRRMFSSSGYVFLLWVMGSSLVLLLVAILFMRNQIRPIRKLSVAANRFGKGRDTPSFKPEGAAEVRQAAHAFLDMRRRIQRQITQRTEMLAGVSHDLRTPLTRMKLQIEMLPEGQDKIDLHQDLVEMERMIEGYLDFVRGEGDEQHGLVDLNALFEKLVSAFKRQGAEIHMTQEDGLKLSARPLALERALGNFLSNSVKYANTIWIDVRENEKYIQIRIEDDGPGVSEDLYEEIFKPFVRVDTSRNSDTGGVGLGLPIAQDIVHAHGGIIMLSGSDRGGLCVMVRIPI